MLLNIVDGRKRRYRWKRLHAIIESTWHDNSCEDSDKAEVLDDPDPMPFHERKGITLGEAVAWANASPHPLTLYLYDYEPASGREGRPVIHPGEILAEELAETGIDPAELARQIQAPARAILEIIQGRRAITCDMALRLGHWFGMPPRFWTNLQIAYDLCRASEKAGAKIERLPRWAKSRWDIR